MARPVPRHDRDAGGPADVLAAKGALRQEVWSAMREAKVARFPGAEGRIPNFTGAEAAARRLASTPATMSWSTSSSPPSASSTAAPSTVRDRPPASCWDDLTEEKIAAIPLLSAVRRLEG